MTTAELLNGTDERKELVQTNQAQNDSRNEPLFVHDEAEHFRSEWMRVQGMFVDDPRRAVEEADQLVASAIKRLTEVFANERGRLEQEWGHKEDVSTEDFRQALRRYRSFFDRLLSV